MISLGRVLLAIEDFATKPEDLGLPNVEAQTGVNSVLEIVFIAAGLVATIFIIIGGIKYTLSGGDSAGIKSAKETITYAIVGLVISLLAFGIVNYVTNLG